MKINDLKKLTGLTTRQFAELIEYSAPYVSKHKDDHVLTLKGDVIQRIIDKTFLTYDDLRFETLNDYVEHLQRIKKEYELSNL